MGELCNPYPKLPKNIRQIGERDQIVKLYVEDYVNTYLKRLRPTGGQDLRVGLLLGNMEINDGTPYIFIDGAMEMEEVAEPGQMVEFTDQSWSKANQGLEELFPKSSIQGWFLCGAPGSELSPLNYWKQHVQYFQGPNKLMYLNGGEEGEESVYITSEGGFYKLCGYSVYYERNQMMQDYMVLRKDAGKIEVNTDEKVIQEFRKRLDDRRDQAVDRRQTLSLMRGLCTAMSVVILAGGIVMFNNYQKMREMELVIVSAVPKGVQPILVGNGENMGGAGMEEGAAAKEDKPESKVVIEEADGGVYPTSATVTAETMKEAVPQTPPQDENAGRGNGGPDAKVSGQKAGGGANAGESKNAEAGLKPEAGQKSQAAPKAQEGQKPAASQKTGEETKAGAGNAAESGQKTQTGQGAESKKRAESDKTPAAGNGSGQKAEAAPKTEPDKKSQAAGASDNAKKAGGAAASVTNTRRIHVVETGETLYSICFAEYHSVNRVKEICELNGLEDENKIIAGQKLLLPQ